MPFQIAAWRPGVIGTSAMPANSSAGEISRRFASLQISQSETCSLIAFLTSRVSSVAFMRVSRESRSSHCCRACFISTADVTASSSESRRRVRRV